MIYVMSDIHGCYELYRKMLEKISFSKADTLYILGDVVDRGTDGMKVLLDIAERETVILLRGNHDQQALVLLTALYVLDGEKCSEELEEVYKMWLSDGGEKTQEVYFDDKYIITGHTPTGYIDERAAGRIWKGNHHIAIDCGAVFGYGLGCLCLDSMEEFYCK